MYGRTNAQDVLRSAAGAITAATTRSTTVATQMGRKRAPTSASAIVGASVRPRPSPPPSVPVGALTAPLPSMPRPGVHSRARRARVSTIIERSAPFRGNRPLSLNASAGGRAGLTGSRAAVYARCTLRRRRAAHPVSARQEGRGMSAQRLLIRNGFVVSMDPDLGDIPNADVFVEDGKIVEVGRGLAVSDAEEVDAAGMIVMPGFVDTHRHTWQTPVRGVLPCCTLDHYFAVMLGQVGGFYRPEDVHIGDYAGALEALNGGVTTLLDWSHINNTPDHSDAAIQGLKDAGIRAVYAHGMPTGGEWWMLSELNHPEDIRRIRETYFSSDDGLLTLAMAARQPGNVNADVAKHDWALARELDILISVHVGMRLHNLHYEPVKDMHDLGLMGEDVCYIHMTDLTDHEMDLIAETGGKASVAPYVEMLLGHGPPPTGKLLARGIRPSLSVDVVSSVPGEMFTQMRTALVYSRILEFTDTPDEAFAPRLTHRDVLEFATIDGARACALEDRVGSLTPGKQADIVLLNVNAINTAPMLDPIGSIVVFSDTSNVD